MRLDELNYVLPPAQIAQRPRSGAKLATPGNGSDQRQGDGSLFAILPAYLAATSSSFLTTLALFLRGFSANGGNLF